ncbi:hypothetical protein GCM10020331_060820 [Ectobacillus funiculus]
MGRAQRFISVNAPGRQQEGYEQKKNINISKRLTADLFTRPQRELYDLSSDPEETINLAETHIELADQFELDLHNWVDTVLQGKEDPMFIQLEKEGLPFS